MSGVKRYDCTDGGAQFCQGCYTMTEREYGDWVPFEDYDALAARHASLLNNLETADRAVALNLELEARLAEYSGQVIELAHDNQELKARLAEAAAIANDGGLLGMSEADALVAIRRLTLPYWNKSGSEVERKRRLTVRADEVRK